MEKLYVLIHFYEVELPEIEEKEMGIDQKRRDNEKIKQLQLKKD